MKVDNTYLYREHKPMNVPDEVIKDRVDALNSSLKNELSINLYCRDFQRVNELKKAINFWETINKGSK